jgi:hypothetical protein
LLLLPLPVRFGRYSILAACWRSSSTPEASPPPRLTGS